DEPSSIDYNTEFRVQDLYTATPYRASDHDPVVIGLNLPAPYTDVSASFGTTVTGLVFNRATQLFTGSLTVKNTSAAALTGPFMVEIVGLPAGVTLSNASGMHNGVPYINVSANSIAAGQAVTLPVSFSNPSKVSISYTVKVSAGYF
ncbi:MAG: endonuclease/exonuclease/phosphatase, partial [Burkholderiales bacterium]|nr:endonuclease/exonuclease/phosphatase [Burkholderiales bacterium]